MAKAQVARGKIVKKEWHPIVSTKSFDSTFLGESYVSDINMLIDRKLTINLANLTGDIRQQGINLKFTVTGVEDGKGVAAVVGYEAAGSQLKRLVRRGVERLDDSILCETSDGAVVRIKPFAVTKSATSKAKITDIRNMLRNALAGEIKKQDFDGLIRLVISNKLQTTMKSAVKKLFPLKAFEVRKIELVSSSTAQPVDAVQPSEESEPAVEEAAEEKPKKKAKKKAPAEESE